MNRSDFDAAAAIVDEVYVISDLHLGGEAPFQIFRESRSLAGLIESLVTDQGAQSTKKALVINGDFVDFLAESPPRHFDPEGAIAKLGRIASDPSFSAVFTALKRFLQVPGSRLGIVVGNHDLELAMPWVRSSLRDLLCGGDAAAAGRIIWSLDGEGILLRIGTDQGARVLCVHGNEVDGWNRADHEMLRTIARDGLRALGFATEYRPNAGSRMVIEVMNGIKQRYPFVDLLKPETQAVIPVLLAMDPTAAKVLTELVTIVARAKLTSSAISLGWLGESARGAETGQLGAPAAVSKQQRMEVQERARVDLLDWAEEDMRAGRAAHDLLSAEARLQSLGISAATVAIMTNRGKVEALREQLRDLADDRSFSYGEPDETYELMNKRVSTNIEFLVCGHTHLARAIERELKRSWYFNTGTWARVFGIETTALGSAEEFRRVFDALASHDIAALDAAPGLLPIRPHVAAFWSDADGTHGELRVMPSAPPWVAAPVPGTRFTRR